MSSSYNRTDHFYRKAKEEGFRSRAAYKLKELDQKYSLLKPGYKVLDLGAWPGGWLQVAAQAVGAAGLAVGIDLVKLDPLDYPNVRIVQGDARDEASTQQLLDIAQGRFDVILSDMSPKLSGIREADACATVACAELALFIAGRLLKKGGNLVMKVFKSNETELFVKSSRPLFNKLVRAELDTTRKTSNEYYLVGLGLK